ncbi:hypothetical protein GX645_06060 [Candidatus Sumerlaeota bacterium]|nr:hypothetical protein [Candidatus Sumerlaeota bacterium]
MGNNINPPEDIKAIRELFEEHKKAVRHHLINLEIMMVVAIVLLMLSLPMTIQLLWGILVH